MIGHAAITVPAETQPSTIIYTCGDVNCDACVLPAHVKFHWHGLARERIFQRDVEIELIISVARLLRSSKSLSKELIDDVIKVRTTEIEMEISSGKPTVETLRKRIGSGSALSKLALLIILRTLLWIAQRVVGFVDLLEQRFAVGVALVEIRMMLFGQLAIGGLDLVR